MRLLWLAVLMASIGWAQFAEFAAPGNGSKLYFSSSLPLQGSGEPSQGRIFSVDATGVHTVADVPATPPSPLTTYYQLSRPELSRDGTILIYTGQRTCYGNEQICESNFSTADQTAVTGLPGGVTNYYGRGRISGNGRYLLLAGSSFGPAASVTDLQTGQSQNLTPGGPAPDGLGRVVADDGTFVSDQALLYITKGAATQSLSFPYAYAQQAVIDSGAQAVVYVQWNDATNLHSIHAYSITQKRDIALFTQGDSTAPFVSADGTRAMFISTASGSPQIWLVNTDATSPRQVTSDPAGVLVAAMSDDGTTGWYLSGSGRVIQIDLNAGAINERIGRTPNWSEPQIMTPGAAWTLAGAGFSDSTFTASGYPLPEALGGVTISIGGIAAPIFSVAPTQIVVQVPWEIPAANFSAASISVVLNTVSASPFTAALAGQVAAWTGFGVFTAGSSGPGGYGSPYALAVHQDWSALVTPANPARPNEIVHFYGLDFGPVESHPADGMPASANSLSPTIAPITCWAWGADNTTKLTLPVLFSGLAPGVAGYDQLDIQLPSGNLRPDTQLSCTGSGYDDGFFGDIPVQTPLAVPPARHNLNDRPR